MHRADEIREIRGTESGRAFFFSATLKQVPLGSFETMTGRDLTSGRTCRIRRIGALASGFPTAADRTDDGPSTRPGPERMEADIEASTELKASSRIAT
jgi:hypothetical protein